MVFFKIVIMIFESLIKVLLLDDSDYYKKMFLILSWYEIENCHRTVYTGSKCQVYSIQSDTCKEQTYMTECQS